MLHTTIVVTQQSPTGTQVKSDVTWFPNQNLQSIEQGLCSWKDKRWIYVAAISLVLEKGFG